MPPKILAKNADRTGGVLPVNAATRANASKASNIRLKLEIRRLPPGLTLSELEETLGDEWKLGNGKVDWREYRQGKTRAPGSGKVPQQSRCYIHVVSEPLLKELERRFLEVVFQDKAGTHRNPELKNLQPSLGFAPNQRTPLQQAKQRTDNRQGTIDQDREFIAFLESETQPIVKPAALDASSLDNDGEKKEIKTTPLIEDLRERKANKAKAALAKAEKEKKAAKGSAKDGGAASTEKESGKAQKVGQAAKDAATALNKQAAAKQQQQTTSKTASPTKAKKAAPSSKKQASSPASPPAPSASKSANPALQRATPAQRQRGNTDGIKKMLEKDLGIKLKTSNPAPSTSASASTPAAASPAPATTAADAKSAAPASQNPAATNPAPSSEPKSPPVKAYLKHANPSQGVTEILIQQALVEYGEVTSVAIDPRKGTAIAFFKEPEALKKALEAKRVPVASGAVEVLEFRERAATGSSQRGGFRGGRGGRGGARGGGQGAAAGTTAPSAPSQAS